MTEDFIDEPDDHRVAIPADDEPGEEHAIEMAEQPDDHPLHGDPVDEPGEGHHLEMADEPDDDAEIAE